ncbi:MAG TPA: hypothetical protein VF702_12350 [Allosphingosinicella sp.]
MLLSAALCGCFPAPDARPPLPPAASAVAPGDPLALYPGGRGGEQASLTGRLALEDGCLYVVDSRGQRWVPAFRSPGTSWDAASRSVATRWGRFGVGEAVRLGGGELEYSAAAPWVKRPPATCDLTRLWLLAEPL